MNPPVPQSGSHRILVVSESFTAGGLETQIAGQCDHLAALGHEMHLATGSPPGSPSDRFAGRRMRLSGTRLPLTAGGLCADVEALVGYVRRHRIDCIHAHPFLSAFPAVVAAALCEIPVLLTLHGPDSVNPDTCYGFNHRWFYERAIFPYCHRIFAVSPDLADLASGRLDGPPPSVLPNGVNLERIPEVPRNADVLARWAVIGRLGADKTPGVIAFIADAFASGVRVVELFGDGECRADVEARFRVELEAGKLVLHGLVDAPYLRLDSRFSGVAGMGRALLESAATGLPTSLVGYRGNAGLLTRDRFAAAARVNFTDRGAPLVSPAAFRLQLDALAADSTAYSLRSCVAASHAESGIWTAYLQTLTDARACHLPGAVWDWLRALPPAADLLAEPLVAKGLDAVLTKAGHPGSCRLKKLIGEMDPDFRTEIEGKVRQCDQISRLSAENDRYRAERNTPMVAGYRKVLKALGLWPAVPPG